jgi:hypothetical protein
MLSIPTVRILTSYQISAASMAPRRLITAATLLGFGLGLASCGGFVADHWPHWAGGMPADVPPRPGAPGYGEFIAHGQAAPEVKQQTPAVAGVQGTVQPGAAMPAAAASAPAAPEPSGAPVRAPIADSDVTQDSSVVNGGLY